MVSIVLNGACGRMGEEFAKVVKKNIQVAEIVAGVDLKISDRVKCFDFSISENFPNKKVDVIVDFSNPSALNKILNFAEKNKVAAVLATTGYNKEQIEQIKKTSKSIPIFFTFNMSIGINLLVNLAKKAALALGSRFDVEIIEKHHNQKVDAPSGTALLIADALNDCADGKLDYVFGRHDVMKKRGKNDIGIHSIRGGNIVGEHEVIFAGCDEVISMKHVASSKAIFAQGAFRAAMFIKDKEPGLYDMDDLIRN